MQRILIARLDRLGDVLMTLPTLEYLRQALPDTELDFACREEFHSVLEPYLQKHRIHALIPANTRVEWSHLLSTRHYDAALLLYPTYALAVAAWKSKIPLRMGVYSKWLSFALANAGLRQKRSTAKKNEAEYNLELGRLLVKKVGGTAVPFIAPIEIPPDTKHAHLAEDVLEGLGIQSGNPFIIVHPGMGGSAINASAESYVTLIKKVRSVVSWPIVLSVGPLAYDQVQAEKILAKEHGLLIAEGLSLPLIRELFRKASLVIAPSTGPLHLAHYVGTKTAGIFSPVKSHRAERWAPWGGKGESQILVPPVNCPAKKKCLGEKCPSYPCVERMFQSDWILETEAVIRKLIEH